MTKLRMAILLRSALLELQAAGEIGGGDRSYELLCRLTYDLNSCTWGEISDQFAALSYDCLLWGDLPVPSGKEKGVKNAR